MKDILAFRDSDALFDSVGLSDEEVQTANLRVYLCLEICRLFENGKTTLASLSSKVGSSEAAILLILNRDIGTVENDLLIRTLDALILS